MKRTLGVLMKSNECMLTVVILLVCLFFGLLNPVFFSIQNVYDILKNSIVNGIFACTVMVVMISGGVDLSFMSIAISAAYITTKALVACHYAGSIVFIFAIAAGVGLVLGLVNAYFISKFDIPVFIVTLSTSSIYRGLLLGFVGNDYIASSDMPRSTIEFSKFYVFNLVGPDGTTFGLHISVFIMLGIMILTHLILTYTTIGRGIFALGGDPVSASRIGFNLNRVRTFIYAYAGVIAGIAGVVFVSNNRTANPFDLHGEELAVIAAVVLGGASIEGGKGKMLGVALGVLLTVIINNNLVLIGVPSYWQKATFGVLIIVAALIQVLKDRLKAKSC